MEFPRRSGILLHPTSLPGGAGIGDLGNQAYRFVDFLVRSHQRIWQVLPLGPTGYGDSPYQSFSSFAGNPLLISLDRLVEGGLMSASDLSTVPSFSANQVDYGTVILYKLSALTIANVRFQKDASSQARAAFDAFCRENQAWLDDYALFAALKEAHGGAPWTDWESDIALREPAALEQWRARLADAVACRKYWQFLFFGQWYALKDYCHKQGVQIMGDIPIYVAQDSADVWAHREFFRLNKHGRPTVVAGVPPDYFSATGQLWGNPIYQWRRMARSGYRWWIDRVRATFKLVDIVRFDHFRGFEAFWVVPAKETTAVHGRWVNGPGYSLFKAIHAALGEAPIVAENLGIITPEVEALRRRCGFPGMAVLQFAFGPDPDSPGFVPYQFARDLVVYTGTHDNETTAAWWRRTENRSNSESRDALHAERVFVQKYLHSDGDEIHWDLIRLAMASVAGTVIVPLQDVLGLGEEARMNQPGRPDGNWRWRFRPEMLASVLEERLRDLTTIYGRSPRTRPPRHATVPPLSAGIHA